MLYFLDFGTHYLHGSVYENGIVSLERRGYFGFAPPYPWHVLTFEPSPYAYQANKQHLPAIATRFLSMEAYPAAVANFNGIIDFKWCPSNEAGSHCLGHTVREVSEVGATIFSVPAVDVKCIVEEVAAEDPGAAITLKCDIEGAEFAVLPRLLEMQNAERWVKEIFVEWHERFWEERSDYQEIVEKMGWIKEQCQKRGIILHDWQ